MWQLLSLPQIRLDWSQPSWPPIVGTGTNKLSEQTNIWFKLIGGQNDPSIKADRYSNCGFCLCWVYILPKTRKGTINIHQPPSSPSASGGSVGFCIRIWNLAHWTWRQKKAPVFDHVFDLGKHGVFFSVVFPNFPVEECGWLGESSYYMCIQPSLFFSHVGPGTNQVVTSEIFFCSCNIPRTHTHTHLIHTHPAFSGILMWNWHLSHLDFKTSFFSTEIPSNQQKLTVCKSRLGRWCNDATWFC